MRFFSVNESQNVPISWNNLSQNEKSSWIQTATLVRSIIEGHRQTLSNENPATVLRPAIQNRRNKKFRGPDGKFASLNPSTKPEKKKVLELSQSSPEISDRTKRKSLIAALDRVKEWSNEKSEKFVRCDEGKPKKHRPTSGKF